MEHRTDHNGRVHPIDSDSRDMRHLWEGFLACAVSAGIVVGVLVMAIYAIANS